MRAVAFVLAVDPKVDDMTKSAVRLGSCGLHQDLYLSRCCLFGNSNDSRKCCNTWEVTSSMAGAPERHDMLRVLAEQQAALRRVAVLVARGVSPDDVFAAVAEEMATCLHVAHATVCRYETDGSFTFAASHDTRGGRRLRVGERLPLEGDNVALGVLRARRPVRIDTHEYAAGPAGARIRELGLRSGVGAPILVDGRVWGAAIVGSSEPQPLPVDTEARIR